MDRYLQPTYHVLMELKLSLWRPSSLDKSSFLSAFNELEEKSDQDSWIYMGESSHVDLEHDFPTYVSALLERQTNPPQGFVRDTVFWAKSGDEVVGRISIRHELNDFLRKIGGHIGYIVRPSWRGRGVATEMLRQLLQTPKAKEIRNLLLTCDETNLASEKTIVKNGGVFEALVDLGKDKPKKKHFWIRLGEQ